MNPNFRQLLLQLFDLLQQFLLVDDSLLNQEVDYGLAENDDPPVYRNDVYKEFSKRQIILMVSGGVIYRCAFRYLLIIIYGVR